MRTRADEIGSHLSCDCLPQKEPTTDGYQPSGYTDEFLSPRPSMDRTDPDPQRVQAPCRNDEAHAIKQRALAGRQFGSVCMPVEYGEEADQRRGNTQGRAHFEHYGSTKKDRRESDSISDSRQRHSH